MTNGSDESVTLRTLDGGTKTLDASVVQQLVAGIRGELLREGDAGYGEARKIWNGMIDRRPALIVRCTGTADVVHAVNFVREHGLLSSVRGGGHNIAGLAICDGGLVIDLCRLKGVWVDTQNKVARAQPGCTLGDLDRETQLHGLASVLGFVSETGIAGLTVGGGFGYLTRRYGWTCDNLVSIEVVTADGKVRRAAPGENDDLFWGLRGGGGNFGIVTSFEYKLYPVGPIVVAGGVAWPGDAAAEVLEFYREFSVKAPRELTCVAALRLAPPAPWLPPEIHGKPMVAIFACHTGPIEDAEPALAPLKSFGRPVADIVTQRPYAQMQSLLDGTAPKGRRYYWKSEYVGELQPGLFDAAVEHLSTVPSPHSATLIFQVDGALNELSADHSPMGNRDAKYVVNVAGSWEHPNDDESNIAWVRSCWSAVRPFSTGGVYVNFLGEDEGADRIEAAYGKPTLARLAEIKRKYDPDNLFRHTKGVLGAT